MKRIAEKKKKHGYREDVIVFIKQNYSRDCREG
jgi:hypothetical protein